MSKVAFVNIKLAERPSCVPDMSLWTTTMITGHAITEAWVDMSATNGVIVAQTLLREQIPIHVAVPPKYLAKSPASAHVLRNAEHLSYIDLSEVAERHRWLTGADGGIVMPDVDWISLSKMYPPALGEVAVRVYDYDDFETANKLQAF